MPDLEAVRKFFEGDKYATEVSGIVIEEAQKGILDSDTVTVTQTAQINFLRPWFGGKVTCHADIVKDGRAICLYEVKVFDKDNKELALIIVNGFKTARK